MALRRFVALAAVSLMSAVGGVAATAAPAAAMCPPETSYGLTATSNHMKFAGIPTFKDGKGGTISVTKDFSSSVSYQVTAGAETEAGVIFAKAKVSVSASLTKTNTSTVTHNYSHKISKNRYGHAQYVSWGKTVRWKKYQQMGNCTVKVVGSGTIRFPTHQEGWRYWETKS